VGASLAAAVWDDHARAARMLAAASALAQRLGMPLPIASNPALHERLAGVARVMLGDPDFDAAWSAGSVMTLTEAIQEVRSVVPPGEVTEPVGVASDIALSPREHEILRLLVAGNSDREMAELLYLSVRTIEAHVARLRAKLGVRTRTAAVTTAIAIGLVDPVERWPDQAIKYSPHRE